MSTLNAGRVKIRREGLTWDERESIIQFLGPSRVLCSGFNLHLDSEATYEKHVSTEQ